jgi:hypothetical protein
MAVRSDITDDDLWFVGEDKQLSFELLDSSGNPVDASSMTLSWIVRRRAKDTGTPLISKTSGAGISVNGTFDAVRALNTQRVLVAVADTDTDALPSDTYQHALKRTDDGSEAVLCYGDLRLLQAATH